MRSVVVVLPASMCAEIPMLRYRSIGVTRATETPFRARLAGLPAIVGEGFVRLRHAMRVLALAHCRATIFRGIHQLMRETERHGLLASVARRVDDPAHGERLAAGRTHLDRHLIGGA